MLRKLMQEARGRRQRRFVSFNIPINYPIWPLALPKHPHLTNTPIRKGSYNGCSTETVTFEFRRKSDEKGTGRTFLVILPSMSSPRGEELKRIAVLWTSSSVSLLPFR
jgi:hypothetical protein